MNDEDPLLPEENENELDNEPRQMDEK